MTCASVETESAATLRYQADQLNNQHTIDELRVLIAASSENTNIVVEGFADWSEAQQHLLVQLLRATSGDYEISIDSVAARHSNLLDFALAQLRGPADPSRCERARRFAVYVAATVYANELLPVCNRIADALRERGLRGAGVRSLISEAEDLVRGQNQNAEDDEPEPPQSLSELLPDIPVADTMHVPAGWRLDGEGIRRAGQQIIPMPIVISARLMNETDGNESLELAFLRDGQWRQCEIPRRQVASRGAILGLANYGMLVNDTNAADLVQYFAEFERENLNGLPVRRLRSQMGWDDDLRAFQWGQMNLTTQSDAALHDASFRGTNAGDNRLASAFCQSGTFTDWVSAISGLEPYPSARFALYAGLTSPLLSILQVPGFNVHLGGQTSCGKTTALRIAASAWGCPDESQEASVLQIWDATDRYTRRVLGTLKHLPLIIDECELADKDQAILELLYTVVGGRDRGRARGAGVATTRTWRTVLLTCGETPLGSILRKGGALARTFRLRGSPFGRQSAETGELVVRLNQRLLRNYGWAGPHLVQHLLRTRTGWPQLREAYEQRRTSYAEHAGNTGSAHRKVGALAAVAVAAQVVHEAIPMPWPFEDPVELLWNMLMPLNDGDLASGALQHVLDWAVGHRASFYDSSSRQSRQPLGGWAGRWDADGEYLGIRPEVIRNLLRAAGFDAAAIVDNWSDRGWLQTTPAERDRPLKVRVANGEAMRVYAITRAAIARIDGVEPPAD